MIGRRPLLAIPLALLAALECDPGPRSPLTIQERIDRAEAVYRTKSLYYETTCVGRHVAVAVDADGHVTEFSSSPGVAWFAAYREMAPCLPPDGGWYIVDLSPSLSQ